jgi:hypothetical protein
MDCREINALSIGHIYGLFEQLANHEADFFIIIIKLPISELSLVVDLYTKFYSSNSKFSVPA